MPEIRAPRGTSYTAQGWPQEAAKRMLMNNLDPDVAERPEELVVYGGTGRAARDWPSFHAIVRELDELRDDETLLVQSGRPVGGFRTHEWAPRGLIANANLGGDWAAGPEVRRLEKLGLTMYGQMTAGSWIYIGTQGILQGTYETFAAVAAKRFGGSLAGTLTLTAGCGGMGGAQPLAVTMNDGVCLVVDVDRAPLQRRVDTRYPDVIAHDPDDAVTKARQAQRDRRRPGGRRPQRRAGKARAPPGGGGCRRHPRGVLPRAAAQGRRDRHRHRPDQRPRPAVVRAGGGGAGRRPRLGRAQAGRVPRPG